MVITRGGVGYTLEMEGNILGKKGVLCYMYGGGMFNFRDKQNNLHYLLVGILHKLHII